MPLVAIRFFRNLIGSQDDFYIKHLTEKQVLGPILAVLVQTLPRDNLLSSACLELFEFIKKENVKDLVKYLVQNHRETLVSLSHLDTFRELIARHDQPQAGSILDYFPEEPENSKRPSHPMGRNMEHIAMDMADEEYWNTSDDEDGPESKALDRPSTNGDSTPQSKPLVDYPSDEEGDENQEKPDAAHEAAAGEPLSTEDVSVKTPTATVAPPERLSEKRRREEEDEDELGKLMQSKRRNSSGSISSNSSINSAGIAKRKKSFADRSSPSAAPRKISINISPSVKTGGNTRSDEES